MPSRISWLLMPGLTLFWCATAAAQPIKIGVPLPLTGSLAEAGAKQERGYEMCKEVVNARGGVKVGSDRRPIEFVKYDYQSETNRAVQMTQRLVTVDKVNFLFSPYGSGDTKAAGAVAERYGIPMIASGAAAESIFDQGFKNIFGILFPSREISKAEVKYYTTHVPRLKRIAILSMNSLYPKSIAVDVKKEAEAAGIQVVYEGSYSPDTLDFATVISQIKERSPDWIYVTGYTQANVLIRRQLVDQNLVKPLTTMTLGPTYPEFAENLGPSANGVTSASWWHANVRYDDKLMFGSTQAYVRKFKEKYGYQPADVDAAATATCEVVVAAIELAESTNADAVRKVLAGNQFDTFYGPIKFGANGQNSMSTPVLVQIKGGVPLILSPDSMKESELAAVASGR